MIQLRKSLFHKICQMVNLDDKEAEGMISLALLQGRGVKSTCIAFYRALIWLDGIWGITFTMLII